MRARARHLAVALAVVGWSAQAVGEEPVCGGNTDCPPWAQCTTTEGECGSAKAPLSVCTGTCEAGRSWRLVPQVAGTAALVRGPRLLSGLVLGLEVTPPVLDGRLVLAADYWTSGLFRLGMGAQVQRSTGFVTTLRWDLAWVSRVPGSVTGVRVEWFPYLPFDTWTPAHYFSVALEAGVLWPLTLFQAPVPTPYVTLGLRFWPGL